MSILGTDAYRYALASALAAARTSISIISAYMTITGIEWVLERVHPSVTSCKVIARWDCDDLISGASDLEVYNILRSRGARFFVLPHLHAKVVLVDDQELLVSSANITGSGLKLVPGGNREIGVKVAASPEDIVVIDAMIDEATEVTPELYDEFRQNVERLKKLVLPHKKEGWSTELLQKLQKGPRRLWVAELFWCENPDAICGTPDEISKNLDAQHDVTLLSIEVISSTVLDSNTLRMKFSESRAWRWLISRLMEADGREMYFGHLSAALHDALLDDPKPYRQDVKRLVANLIRWVEAFGQPSVTVDRPNYSQRLRLNS